MEALSVAAVALNIGFVSMKNTNFLIEVGMVVFQILTSYMHRSVISFTCCVTTDIL
jgi:hypothetical protein